MTTESIDTAETTTDTTETTQTTAESFAEQLLSAALGAQQVQAAYLGDRLGYYRALAAGPLTSTELAARTGTAERYAREWLEHQAVCGVLTVADPAAAPTERVFTLPAAHAEVLTTELSVNYVLPLARLVAGIGRRLDELVTAYRTGTGVSWSTFGEDAREGQAAANRPLFLGALGREYLPSVPAVHAALSSGGRVADIGCGYGWSSIGIALAYPDATVHGFDLDEPSIRMAQRNAQDAGVADRVRFAVADAGQVADHGRYDLVAAFECVHDLPDPVSVLASMRELVAEDGTVLVMDERVAETFHAPGDDIERLMYGYSITCCLPDGLAHPTSVGTGTVMRPSTLAGYARAAGFERVETLPIDNDFFRFYRLVG